MENRKPVIGITAAAYNVQIDVHAQRSTYIKSVTAAGGLPLLIPACIDTRQARQIIAMTDGLLLPGGGDISPLLYGEQPIPQAPTTRKSEDLFEIALIKEAVKQNKPILGICRGMQILNVAFGGTLYQDIPSQYSPALCHLQGQTIRDEGTHLVTMEQASRLGKIFKDREIIVNSYHHQAVKDIAENFVAVGVAPDGITEAMENEDGSILAVQWHPECMPQVEIFRDLFSDFVNRCAKRL